MSVKLAAANDAVADSVSLTDLAARINDEHKAAAGDLLSGIKHVIAAGEALLVARSKVQRGEWLDWIEANLTVTPRSVQMYMQIAKKQGDYHEVTNAKGISHLGIEKTLLMLRQAETDARLQTILDRSGPCQISEDAVCLSRGVVLQERDDETRNELFEQDRWRSLQPTDDEAAAIDAMMQSRAELLERAEALKAEADQLRREAAKIKKEIGRAVRRAFVEYSEAAE